LGATAIHRARHARVASRAVAAEAAPRSPHRSPAVVAAAPARSEVSPPPEVSAPPEVPPPQVAPPPRTPAPAAHEPKVTAPARAPGRSARLGTPADRPCTAKEAGGGPLPPRSSPAVADEARLIHDGVVALRSGDPARALAVFDTHALLYPRGVLSEERDAERALALADLGRAADARAAVERFLRAHPTSPLAARLQERLRLLDQAKP
jgi:hypothetical protein